MTAKQIAEGRRLANEHLEQKKLEKKNHPPDMSSIGNMSPQNNQYQSYDGPVNTVDNTHAAHASQTDNYPLTPNKNVKNEKKGKKIPPSAYLSFEEMEIQRANESFEKAKAKFLAMPE